jgi:hypothetical protein
MQLSKNFNLSEFLVSQTAARKGIILEPSEEVIGNLRRLARDYLQPIRDAVGAPVIISSGYRSEELNTLIGGSKTSAHCHGRASDFGIVGYTAREAAQIIETLNLPFDQLILEFERWVHLGIAEQAIGRGQVMTATRNDDGTTRYTHGLV